MIERLDRDSANLFKAPRFSQVLITEIGFLNFQVNRARESLSDPSVTEETRQYLLAQKKQFVKQVDVDLFCLTNLRQDSDTLEEEIGIQVAHYPGEKLHPFSRNPVIFTFTVDWHTNPSKYAVRTTLRELRGSDVNDSIQAEEFLGQKTYLKDENPATYLHRTAEELSHIAYKIGEIKDETYTGHYNLEYLEDLTRNLITERIIPLKESGLLPNDANVQLTEHADPRGKIQVATKISVNGNAYDFIVPAA
jgi:hypothetical protein